MNRLKLARSVATLVTVLTVVGICIAAFFREDAGRFVQQHDGLFKLVGLAIGPFLALLGFVWGRVDKAELKVLSRDLGEAKQQAVAEKKLADHAKADVEAKIARITSLESDLRTVADAGRIWKLRKNAPFPQYKGWKYDPLGAKIVTVGLFKGGVGKSHLTANFAAYVSEKQKKPVLIIDVDYQGSVSAALLSAAGLEDLGSRVDALFDETATLATLSQARVHLTNQGNPEAALNGGRGLSQAWLVPAGYSLTELESRLLIDRVMHERPGIDERYRLAHILLHPSVRRDYAMIIIDTPPRMSLGTVNALVASHFYVVPTILDRISSEAVKPFLTQVELLKNDLQLDLKLAGVVATMTREINMKGNEPKVYDDVNATVCETLGRHRQYMIAQNLPRKKPVTDSNDLGYFLKDGEGPLRERFYDAIFDELWTRIMSPQESE